MAFRRSPNLVASGAMGILTGLAIAGGLVFALSFPASADGARKSWPSDTNTSAIHQDQRSANLSASRRGAAELDLRTFGNSTARMVALEDAPKSPRAHLQTAGGEVVALNDADLAADQPQG